MTTSSLAGHLDNLFFKIQRVKLAKLNFYMGEPSNASKLIVRFFKLTDIAELQGFPAATEPMAASTALFNLLCAKWVADKQAYDVMVVDCGEGRNVVLDSGQLAKLCTTAGDLAPSGKHFEELHSARLVQGRTSAWMKVAPLCANGPLVFENGAKTRTTGCILRAEVKTLDVKNLSTGNNEPVEYARIVRAGGEGDRVIRNGRTLTIRAVEESGVLDFADPTVVGTKMEMGDVLIAPLTGLQATYDWTKASGVTYLSPVLPAPLHTPWSGVPPPPSPLPSSPPPHTPSPSAPPVGSAANIPPPSALPVGSSPNISPPQLPPVGSAPFMPPPPPPDRPMTADNAFSILGISDTATPEDIKTAYRELLLKYHPDRARFHGLSFDEAHKIAADITAAYAFLRHHLGL